MFEENFDITRLENTKKLANIISENTKVGDVIALSGDLGAGKTTFAQFFINNFFGENQNVTSPTFNIALTYDAEEFVIWHFDLYRIEDESELFEIGIEQSLEDGVSIIEWPEIAKNFIPKDALHIELLKPDEQNIRYAKLSAKGSWANRLGDI